VNQPSRTTDARAPQEVRYTPESGFLVAIRTRHHGSVRNVNDVNNAGRDKKRHT
jgi:hypothetical protein